MYFTKKNLSLNTQVIISLQWNVISIFPRKLSFTFSNRRVIMVEKVAYWKEKNSTY